MTLQRWTGGKTVTSVAFSNDMRPTLKKDQFLSNSSNRQFFINMLGRYLQKVGFPNTPLTDRCWSLNRSESYEKCKKGEHCFRVERHSSPYFIVPLHRNECWRIIFSAWAMGKFKKTMCLGHESSEGEAWSRHAQQHCLHPPCNPWMWYYFWPS